MSEQVLRVIQCFRCGRSTWWDSSPSACAVCAECDEFVTLKVERDVLARELTEARERSLLSAYRYPGSNKVICKGCGGWCWDGMEPAETVSHGSGCWVEEYEATLKEADDE